MAGRSYLSGYITVPDINPYKFKSPPKHLINMQFNTFLHKYKNMTMVLVISLMFPAWFTIYDEAVSIEFSFKLPYIKRENQVTINSSFQTGQVNTYAFNEHHWRCGIL